jgi:hypothetical protein
LPSFFLPSSFFFFVSGDDDVDVVDEVSVIVVSVGGGADVSVAAVSVCGRCSRGCGCRAGWVVRSLGIGGVVLPTVSVTTGAFATGAGRVDVRARGGTPGAPTGYEGADGIAEAIEPLAVPVPSGAGLVGSVRFVVVSTFVFVSGGVVSPGALMVDVTPLADPSCTV